MTFINESSSIKNIFISFFFDLTNYSYCFSLIISWIFDMSKLYLIRTSIIVKKTVPSSFITYSFNCFCLFFFFFFVSTSSYVGFSSGESYRTPKFSITVYKSFNSIEWFNSALLNTLIIQAISMSYKFIPNYPFKQSKKSSAYMISIF